MFLLWNDLLRIVLKLMEFVVFGFGWLVLTKHPRQYQLENCVMYFYL
jgi:hypothetical protein